MTDIKIPRKKNNKNTILWILLIFAVLLLGIGGFWGYKTYLHLSDIHALTTRQQILLSYYNALSISDTNAISSFITDDFELESPYSFQSVPAAQFSLYTYTDINTDENTLTFQLIDLSQTPSISYLNEVQYIESNRQLYISAIKTLAKGAKIQ